VVSCLQIDPDQHSQVECAVALHMSQCVCGVMPAN